MGISTRSDGAFWMNQLVVDDCVRISCECTLLTPIDHPNKKDFTYQEQKMVLVSRGFSVEVNELWLFSLFII